MFNSYCARQLFVSLMRAKVLYLLHRLNVTAGKHRALRVLRNSPSFSLSPYTGPRNLRPHLPRSTRSSVPLLFSSLSSSFSVASPTLRTFFTRMYPLTFSSSIRVHLVHRAITRSSRHTSPRVHLLHAEITSAIILRVCRPSFVFSFDIFYFCFFSL